MKSKTLRALVGIMLCLLLYTGFVIAVSEPEGPSLLNVNSTTRRTATAAPTLEAYAGNISHLIVAGSTVTQTWQGYVGNITGTITLDDASNNTLYDWTLADPEGEIYATYLPTMDWSTGNILCWNWSTAADPTYLQLAELEGSDTSGVVGPTSTVNFTLGLASDDVDGVDETFSYSPVDASLMTNHSTFYVAGQLINGSGLAGGAREPAGGGGPCPNTKLYNGTGSGVFEQVLLYQDITDTENDGVIYTSIILSDQNGYDNNNWDFEMIVGENGHNGNTATTTYYFYVELE